MVSSSEFIKGYTKMIICSYLFNGRNYLYNIVKQILIDGEGYIKLSNPSALIIMKELEEEELVSFTLETTNNNQIRKYYELTLKGRNYYLSNKDEYITSLNCLKKLIGDKNER